MNTESNVLERLKSFLDKLKMGKFDRQIDTAFEELNLVISRYDEARNYFTYAYLPSLYTDSRFGKQHIIFIADGTTNYVVPNLAKSVSEALIMIYEREQDEEILETLLCVILQYSLFMFIGIENRQRFRFRASDSSFSIPVNLIKIDLRVKLLQLTLKKYVNLLITGGAPNSQELPSVINRLNDVLGLLSGIDTEADLALKNELFRYNALFPFSFNTVRFSPKQSTGLFGSEFNVIEYETRLFEEYKIPLFPVITSDGVEFSGKKVTFTNEGIGSLPPSFVRIQVADQEFELGQIRSSIPSTDSYDLFIDEYPAFVCFLNEQKPSLDVKVTFSFNKFRRSYDFGVLSKNVGHWLEKIPRNELERAIPYEIPLEKLNEKQFERLCMWIVDEAPDGRQFEDVLWLNEDGGGERGRDVIAVEVSTRKKWVFQCKHVKSFGSTNMKDELTKFARYITEDPSIKPDVYVLFISRAVTDLTKSTGDKLAETMGIEIKYWPKSRIDKLVRTNSKVKRRFWAVV